MELIVMAGPEDSETLSGAQPLVKSANSPAFVSLSNEAAADERQSVFTSLVGDDSDVVGLVAYSIYKQNKHDFLVAFHRQSARPPNEAEISAYIMGEATPRRLAIYRHLAQSTLAGKSPDVQTAPGLRVAANSGFSAILKSPGGLLLLANLGLVSALFVWLLVRFGLTG
jgi:hypothetical protein